MFCLTLLLLLLPYYNHVLHQLLYHSIGTLNVTGWSLIDDVFNSSQWEGQFCWMVLAVFTYNIICLECLDLLRLWSCVCFYLGFFPQRPRWFVSVKHVECYSALGLCMQVLSVVFCQPELTSPLKQTSKGQISCIVCRLHLTGQDQHTAVSTSSPWSVGGCNYDQLSLEVNVTTKCKEST